MIFRSAPMRSTSRVSTRSRPAWVTLAIRPSSRCFRSSMQKLGGRSGRSGRVSGRVIRGKAPFMSMKRFTVRLCRFTCSSREERLGMKILYILPPLKAAVSSRVRSCRVMPSRFMVSSKICTVSLNSL